MGAMGAMRSLLRLARWRLGRSWRRLRVAAGGPERPGRHRQPGGTGGHRPRAGWPVRGLLWALAAARISCPLLALSVVCLRATRAPFPASRPRFPASARSLLLLDRQGRPLGELHGQPAARGPAAPVTPEPQTAPAI